MRISRLYVTEMLAVDKQITLDDVNAHYVRDVLRLKTNARIVVFNGEGGEFCGQLVEVSRKTVKITLEKFQDRSVESPLHINLGLGISRGDRMDFSVQKAVELGVNRITPLITERCMVQFKDNRKSGRLLHWQKIAEHAAEQSGRTRLAEFYEVDDLENWLRSQQGLKIFLDPYANLTLAQLKPDVMQLTLLTGPEGGFSDQERTLAIAAGFIPVRLGSRILRTETASLAAIAAVQMLWGDFGNENK